MKTELLLERYSAKGKTLEKRTQLSRSWLKHFFDLFYPCLTLSSLTGVNDIGGSARTLAAMTASDAPTGTLQVASAPGNIQVFVPAYVSPGNRYCYKTPQKGEDIGIVVGTGNLAVTPTQDALQTIVTHGETVGKLLYGGCELYGLAFANPNGQFTIRRYFTNVAGGNIPIQEVGIYAVGVRDALVDEFCYSFCIARDVVAPGVTVANGEILRVTYVVQITV